VGARRALGHFNARWTEPELAKAHKSINKHFGLVVGEKAPVTRSVKTKGPMADRAKAKREKKVEAKQKAAAPALSTPKVKKERKPKSKIHLVPSITKEESEVLHQADKYVGTLSQAISALHMAHDVDPTINVKNAVQTSADALEKVVNIVSKEGIDPYVSAATSPSNGGVKINPKDDPVAARIFKAAMEGSAPKIES
jgi:hypothetical protein